MEQSLAGRNHPSFVSALHRSRLRCFEPLSVLRLMGASFIVAAIGVCSMFCRFLVARELRILQVFAGICRAILLKFFRITGGWATHNP